MQPDRLCEDESGDGSGGGQDLAAEQHRLDGIMEYTLKSGAQVLISRNLQPLIILRIVHVWAVDCSFFRM